MNRLFAHCAFWCLLFPALAATQTSAQDLQSGLESLAFGGAETPEADFSARFIVNPDGRTGKLEFIADVADNCHIFSVTQKYPGGPGQPTVITIGDGFTHARVTGAFEADQDFEIVESEFADEPGEEHHGTVTWSAPLQFADGVNANDLVIPVKYKAQVCVDGPTGSCLPFSGTIKAVSTAAAVTFAYEYQPENAHATVRGWLDHTHLQPGDSFQLKLQIEPQANWQIDGWAATPAASSSPTLIVISKGNEANFGEPAASVQPVDLESGASQRRVHKETVTWTIPVKLPRKLSVDRLGFAGWVGFRASQGQIQGDPTAVAFRFELPIGTATVDGKTDLVFSTPEGADYGEVASLAQKEFEKNQKNAGQFSGLSIPAVLGLAFIAGLILNVMPCVLPVIGLKVLSFVQQAGENPRRVLLLNLVFAAGIICVFLLLAAFAAFMGLGWGGLFESQAFTIVMVTVVFAFGLSFLGVWEIPIPGFVAAGGHGKAAQQEGYMGAFLKGILTTLLATPCSGPLLIPAVTWAIAQPPAITFLTFLALGLGMAFPFILIGFRPSLVSWLPKPGEWMETFKQLMGFVMVATAVFFFNPISDKYEMPVLAFLVFVGLACWMAGRISLLQEFPVRMRKWAAALLVLGLGGFVAFYLMVPQHELEWQPYSQATLSEKIAEGNVVFVDFTADW